MTLVGNLRRQRRLALHLLAHEEEGGRGTGLGQQLEHRGRALRVRAVVEGDRHLR